MKVGDRIQIKNDYLFVHLRGLLGTIVYVWDQGHWATSPRYRVLLDDPPSGWTHIHPEYGGHLTVTEGRFTVPQTETTHLQALTRALGI